MTKRKTWRVGRKVGRTLYVNDELVGVMDTPELAAEVVQAMQTSALIASEQRRHGLLWISSDKVREMRRAERDRRKASE